MGSPFSIRIFFQWWLTRRSAPLLLPPPSPGCGRDRVGGGGAAIAGCASLPPRGRWGRGGGAGECGGGGVATHRPTQYVLVGGSGRAFLPLGSSFPPPFGPRGVRHPALWWVAPHGDIHSIALAPFRVWLVVWEWPALRLPRAGDGSLRALCPPPFPSSGSVPWEGGGGPVAPPHWRGPHPLGAGLPRPLPDLSLPTGNIPPSPTGGGASCWERCVSPTRLLPPTQRDDAHDGRAAAVRSTLVTIPEVLSLPL